MTVKNFDLDSARYDLIESYETLTKLIYHEYTGAQLKRDVAAARQNYCAEDTAKILYGLFGEEINALIDRNVISQWYKKDENYVERVVTAMVNKFIAQKSKELYDYHKKDIDKNPAKKIAEFVYTGRGGR